MTVRKRKNLPETPDAFLLGSELSQEQEGGSGFAEHDDENGEKKVLIRARASRKIEDRLPKREGRPYRLKTSRRRKL